MILHVIKISRWLWLITCVPCSKWYLFLFLVVLSFLVPQSEMRPQISVFLGTVVSFVCAQEFNGDWDAAYTKATTALAKLSTSEKVGLVTGIGWGKGPCTGNTSPLISINFRTLCLQGGPLGVRSTTGITAFPPGTAV
jgi:hypothetical protein